MLLRPLFSRRLLPQVPFLSSNLRNQGSKATARRFPRSPVSPHEINKMLMSFKTSQADPGLIFSYFEEVKSTLSPVNVATLLTTLANSYVRKKIAPRAPPAPRGPSQQGGGIIDHVVFAEILDLLVKNHVREMDGFGLGSVANSLSRLDVPQNLPVWQVLTAAILEARLSRFNPQSLVMVVAAYAKVGVKDPALLSAVEQAVTAKISLFDSLALANVAAAFGKLAAGSHEFNRMLGLATISSLPSAQLKDLPIISMNFARVLGPLHHDSELQFPLVVTGEKEKEKGAESPPQEREEIIGPLLTLVEKRMLGNVAALDSVGALNLAWAFGKSGVRSRPLFDEIGVAAVGWIEGLRPAEISTLCWAFAKVEVPCPAVLDKVSNTVVKRRTAFEPQHLANIAWAFSRLNVRSETLFSAIALETKGRLDSFSPLGVTNVIAAFAKLKIYDAALVRKVETRITLTLNDFSASELALLAWAFAEITLHECQGAVDYEKLSTNRRGIFSMLELMATEKRDQFRTVHRETLQQALKTIHPAVVKEERAPEKEGDKVKKRADDQRGDKVAEGL